jgi:purine-binding chemotaxis protein CheW
MAFAHRRRIKLIGRAAALSAEERLRLILEERTERLAARAGHESTPPVERERVVVCTLGREQFGIPVAAVALVLPFPACVPVAASHPALIGHFGRAGHLVSVLDLALALGLPPTGSEGGHCLLLRRDRPHVALRVDRVQDVASVARIAGEGVAGVRSNAVVGLAQGLAQVEAGSPDEPGTMSLLDVERLLAAFLTPSSAHGA